MDTTATHNSVARHAALGELPKNDFFTASCPHVGLRESLALRFVFLDHAVPDGDDTVRLLGNVVFVRHQDNRIAFRVQAIKQRHDLVCRLLLEKKKRSSLFIVTTSEYLYEH